MSPNDRQRPDASLNGPDDAAVTTAAPSMPTSALRPWFPAYRVAAWVVGVFLIVLTLVGMPLKYLADRGEVVAMIGPVHGFGYMAYLAIAAMLALRAKWRPRTTILVLLAGTVPFLSFVAERYVVTRTKSGQTP